MSKRVQPRSGVPGGGCGPVKICLYEDDDPTKRALNRALLAMGYEVGWPGSGLPITSFFDADIAFVDIHLGAAFFCDETGELLEEWRRVEEIMGRPVDGHDVLRAIRWAKKECYRIAMSGSFGGLGGWEAEIDAMAAGAQVTLPKPFEREDLVEALRMATRPQPA